MQDQARFRRFKDGCPFYRENWITAADEPVDPAVLYEIYCLRNVPPLTQKEQDKCMRGRFGCWRLAADLKPPRRPSSTPDTAWPAAADSPG
ncbi:MAG: hypothetical protein NVSMB65_00780 [Chloroflexota bacterium]